LWLINLEINNDFEGFNNYCGCSAWIWKQNFVEDNRVLASQNSLPVELQTKKLIRKSCAVTLCVVSSELLVLVMSPYHLFGWKDKFAYGEFIRNP